VGICVQSDCSSCSGADPERIAAGIERRWPDDEHLVAVPQARLDERNEGIEVARSLRRGEENAHGESLRQPRGASKRPNGKGALTQKVRRVTIGRAMARAAIGGRPAARAVLWAVRTYQRSISAHVARRCAQSPSCSEYALLAVEARGVVRGGIGAIARYRRCRLSETGA
jgi:putative component of membrane protein insertase Oxa1/YidC/SpoIIIJ protein YidD